MVGRRQEHIYNPPCGAVEKVCRGVNRIAGTADQRVVDIHHSEGGSGGHHPASTVGCLQMW